MEKFLFVIKNYTSLEVIIFIVTNNPWFWVGDFRFWEHQSTLLYNTALEWLLFSKSDLLSQISDKNLKYYPTFVGFPTQKKKESNSVSWCNSTHVSCFMLWKSPIPARILIATTFSCRIICRIFENRKGRIMKIATTLFSQIISLWQISADQSEMSSFFILSFCRNLSLILHFYHKIFKKWKNR